MGKVPSADSSWGSWIRCVHFFILVDTYKCDKNLWVCPAVTGAYDDPILDIFGGGLQYWGSRDPDEAAARARTDLQSPTDISTWSRNAVQGNYWYMGYDWSYGDNNTPASYDFWVHKMTDPAISSTGTVTLDPPLMADVAWRQIGAGPGGADKYNWNHGKNWNAPVLGSQAGDIRVNVLYTDGHVENRSPDPPAVAQYGGPCYWYR